MEASSVSQLCSPSLFKPKNVRFSCPNNVSLPFQNQETFHKNRVLKVKCGKGACSSVSEVEKILMENEFNIEEEEKLLIGMKKLNEKCKGVGGIVELLECLEREAIMGEDEGKKPNDYNRRAQIFDKSSRVFQALKHSRSAV